MTRSMPRAHLIGLCSWLILAGLAGWIPQGLHYYDPVVQLQALDQYSRGESPAWNIRLRVDPTDLARDLPEPIGWWPPALPVLVAGLGELGLGYGAALRCLALACSAAGCLGWLWWWRRCGWGDPWLAPAAAALPWLPYAAGPLFRFSAEAFVFGLAPWLYLGAAALLARIHAKSVGWLALAAGAVAGASYLFKYSLFVVVLAVVAGAAFAVWRRRLAGFGPGLRAAVPCALGLAVVPAALRLYHASLGAADPTGGPDGGASGVDLLLFGFGNPALGLADAGGAWFALLVYPGIFGPGHFGSAAVALVGIPGAVLLLCLPRLARGQPPLSLPALVAAGALAGFTLLMAGLWLTSNVARDTRFFVVPGLAALPAVVQVAAAIRPAAGKLVRLALAAGLLAYLVLPAAAGVALAALKTCRGAGVAAGPNGIALPALGAKDQAAVLRELDRHAGPDTVWVVDNPELALGLRGRVLDRNAGRSVAEDMANIYRPPGSVAAWATGRAVHVRTLGRDPAAPPAWTAGLRGAGAWHAAPLPEGLVLWSATMAPSPSARQP